MGHYNLGTVGLKWLLRFIDRVSVGQAWSKSRLLLALRGWVGLALGLL